MGWTRKRLAGGVSLLGLIACGATSEPREVLLDPPESASAKAEVPSSTTTTPWHATTATPSTAVSAEPEGSCLMWHVCGCNEGCSRIALPAPHDGDKAEVLSGPQKGKTAYVAKLKSATGKDVLVLTPDRPGGIMVCAEAPGVAPEIGYLCETSRSGPPKDDACALGCQ